MHQDQYIEVRHAGQTATVRFLIPTITDPAVITEISERIKQLIGEHSPSELVFDFDNVRFFTSQVLGLLLQARAILQPKGGRIVIRSLQDHLRRVFKVTYLDRYFEFAHQQAGHSEGKG